MTKRFFPFFFLLVLTFSACGPSTPQMVASSESPTATPGAIATDAASPTLSALTPTLLFPMGKEASHPLDETPTPIATPETGPGAFRLKKMDEANSAALVQLIHNYAVDGYAPYFDDWLPKSQFASALEPAKLAVREYLQRLPGSRDAQQYRWQQLFYYGYSTEFAEQTDPELDGWMLAQVQAGLDDGSLTPQTLETLFDRYWFDLGLFWDVSNLFGDGKLSWLYQAKTQTWTALEETASLNDEKNRSILNGGLFFVVRELQPGQYRVYLLKSAWANNSNYLQSFGDDNKNGIPEISLYVGAHSGSMCGGSLLIYEWRESEFVELTHGEIRTTDCSDSDTITVKNGAPAIRHDGFGGYSRLYVWDGSFYHDAGSVSDKPLDDYRWLLGDSPEKDIQVLKELLATADFMGHGPGLRDYLRFLLAQAYALAGQPQEAAREFQSLIDSPSDPDRTVFRDFSRRFLQNYRDPKDIYLACLFVSKMYREMIAPYEHEDLDAFQQETMGVLPDQTFSGIHLDFCNENDAVYPLVSAIPTNAYLPALLKQHGLTLAYTQRLDINLDGLDEWLLLYRDSRGDDTGLLVAPQGDFYRAYPFRIGKRVMQPISVAHWKSLPNPVLEIRTAANYTLLEVLPDFDIHELYTEYDPGDVALLDVDTRPIVQYSYRFPILEKDREYSPRLPWVSYVWNPQTHAFDIDWFEYQLFTLKDPAPVVKQLPKLLQRMAQWQSLKVDKAPLARQYYLAALAYELSGDEPAAVQTYWHLWYNFPESPYALMAQFKLEPIP